MFVDCNCFHLEKVSKVSFSELSSLPREDPPLDGSAERQLIFIYAHLCVDGKYV